MKNYLLLITILGLFFWIGVATSPEINIEEYPSTVAALPDALVLTSQSDVPITGAFLMLSIDTVTMNSANFFILSDYDLAANGTDTIPLSNFIFQDSIAYPSGIPPTHFRLEFFANNTDFFKAHEF